MKASADAEHVAQDHVKGKHQDNDRGSDKGKGKVKDKGKGGHALADAGLTATSWTSSVKVHQKCAEVKLFDPSGDLFEGGAHMPLLCYIGSVPRRSADALQLRETQSAARGWGVQRLQEAHASARFAGWKGRTHGHPRARGGRAEFVMVRHPRVRGGGAENFMAVGEAARAVGREAAGPHGN